MGRILFEKMGHGIKNNFAPDEYNFRCFLKTDINLFIRMEIYPNGILYYRVQDSDANTIYASYDEDKVMEAYRYLIKELEDSK